MVIKLRFKKAAMFGLDARIALAIFAALSVISGAAMYNVIRDVKVNVLISSLQEIGKAYEQYLLDTGVGLPGGLLRNAEELITSTAVGWKGPYLPFSDDGSIGNSRISHDLYKWIRILEVEDVGWGYASGVTPTCTNPANRCMIWVNLVVESSSELVGILKRADKKFDGVEDPLAGKLRYQDVTVGSYAGYLSASFYIMDKLQK